jgi:hypothetical protein
MRGNGGRQFWMAQGDERCHEYWINHSLVATCFHVEVSMRHILPTMLLACAAMQAAEVTPIPVTNGDFESGAKAWENGPQLSSAQKHSGGKALALSKGFVFQSTGSMIPVESGNDYQLRLWVKTDGCKPNAGGICAGFRSADGKNLIGGWIEGSAPVYAMDKGQSPVLAVFGGSSDWAEVVIGIPAQQIPAAAKWLHVYLRHDLVQDPTGTIYIDDLRVARLPIGTVPAGQIVKNGSFEQGKSGWWGQGTWSVVGDAGARTLRVDSGFACQDKRPVVGGSRYKISMRVRSDGAPEGSVYVQCSYRGTGVGQGWHGPASANGEAALLVTGGTHDWKACSVVVQAPEGADQILLYLRKQSGTDGAGYFDDVVVVPTDEPLTPKVVVPFTGEIIVNGTFEKGKAPWWGQGTWAVVAGQGTDGSAALRIDTGFVCQDKRPVEERKNYRISMRVRSDGCAENAVYVQTAYRNDEDKPIGSWQGPLRWKNEAAVVVTGGTHDWKDVAIVVQAPPSATQLLLYLRKQSGDGSAWYDDVRVEATDEKAFTVADRRAAELSAELLIPVVAGTDAAAALQAAQALGAGPASERFSLAEGGQARAHLHVGDGADVAILGAAKALAGYLQQMTGATFAAVSHDANAQAGPLVVLGRDGALAAKLCGDVDWDKLGPDGFVIRSVGKHLVIAGGTARGTMYGVNWFLDRQLGVRWLSPDYTHVPSSASLSVAKLDVRQMPHFAYREVLSSEGSDAAFAAHNLMNGRSHGPSYSPTAPEIDNWDHQWMAAGLSADFWDLLDKKTTEKTHPEWFTGGQVAMMDKGMRAAMAQAVIARLKALPDYTRVWFNIWQKDWGWDMDAASQAFAKAHGGHASAPRLDMMIDIADQVRAVLPGARLSMQAYSWGFTPPEGMTVPDYILIFPMTIHVDYSTALNVGRNTQLGADMVGWTKLAKNAMVWDHIANWAGFIQPTPNIYPIGESLRWLSGISGFHGYFCEGNWNSAGGEFGSLRAWLIARMTWDPQQDPRKLVGEWCQLYYGKAGELVRRYVDLMHEAAAKSGDILGQRYMPDLPMYSLEFVTAADALFDQAEAAVADDAVMLGHVRHARMPIDHLILLRRGEYAAAAAQRGTTINLDVANRRARFDQAVIDNKVRQYRQGGKIAELQATLDVERGVAKPDPMVADLPATDWADIQDLAFMRFDTAAIVSDPAASDGAAIRMVGKSSTWAMQLPIERVPKDGAWDLYAAVRVECEPGHDDEPVVRVGSSPPMGLFNTGTAKELSDGTYHLIKVPGGPHHWRGDARLHSIYIQSPAKPWISWIYLDRIIAVRAK